MTSHIYRYDNTPLVSIPDGQLNTSATSLNLPANNYSNYGDKVVENLIYLMEHFAGATPPRNAIKGQVWYNTNNLPGTTNQIIGLQVYNGTNWVGTGKTLVTSTPPTASFDGQLWYNTSTKQLFVSSGVNWNLIGPLGSADINQNPLVTNSSAVPSFTTVDVVRVTDTTVSQAVHTVIRMIVNGTVLAIVSSDTAFTCGLTGFPTIYPGITFNQTVANALFAGKANSALNADSANNLVVNSSVVPSGIFMRRDQNNEPVDNNTFNLGSTAAKYANVYATQFNGTATSALYADLAERYEADDWLDAGTVVAIGGEKEITRVNQLGSSDVFGVISEKPGLQLNSGAGDDRTHPYVALTGRVPVKVVGSVNKGSRLMASALPGVAQKWEPQYGTLAIIGRSLVHKNSHSIELIEATIGTRG